MAISSKGNVGRAHRSHTDDNMILDLLHALKTTEQILEEVLNGEENFVSACQKHNFNQNCMLYLLYNMRTKISNGMCKFSRKELAEMIGRIGNPESVERLYKQVFSGTIAAKEIKKSIPKDAYDTLSYICDYPDKFSLSSVEAHALKIRYLQGRSKEDVGNMLGLASIDQTNHIIGAAVKKLKREKTPAFLLLGLHNYSKSLSKQVDTIRTEIEEKEAALEDYYRIRDELQAESKKTLEEIDAVVAEYNLTRNKYMQISGNLFKPISIDELGLPLRAKNALHRGGFHTLEDVLDADYHILYNIRSMGEKSIADIVSTIQRRIPGWEPQGMPAALFAPQE